jgi:hypothetical protein
MQEVPRSRRRRSLLHLQPGVLKGNNVTGIVLGLAMEDAQKVINWVRSGRK